MTVFGLLANGLILSGGILSFWLLDREVRPGVSARPAPDARKATPAPRAEIPANDEAPLPATPDQDHSPAVGAHVIPLGLYDRARRPAGSV